MLFLTGMGNSFSQGRFCVGACHRGLCYLDKQEYDKAEMQFTAAEDVIVRTGHLKKVGKGHGKSQRLSCRHASGVTAWRFRALRGKGIHRPSHGKKSLTCLAAHSSWDRMLCTCDCGCTQLHWMVRYNLGLTYYHRKQWPMAVQTLDVSGAHGFESLPAYPL